MNTLSEIRVLYVEDDEDYFFLVSESLDEITHGTYRVDWAPSYEEGRMAIFRRSHDIYLIDFRLGAQSGLDLIKETRDSGITKPIILLTGQGGREIDIASMVAGANDFLSKSEINSDLLERAIRYTLNQHEITEQLKLSEERLQDFLETASDWIWEMDSNLKFSSFSGSMNSNEVGNILGKSPQELSAHKPNSLEMMEYQRIVERGEPFSGFEYETMDENGKVYFQKISGKPIFDSSGNFDGYRGTGGDITAQRHIEDQLRQSQKMEAVGQLTGGIAHDFNNILHIIHNNLELLQDMENSDPKFIDRTDRIFRAANRGAGLTQKLLAFSRSQTLNPVSLNPNELVAETFDLLERTLGEDIAVNFDLADSIEPIHVDSGLLGNALLNLSVNGRDAMPAGGDLTIETGTTVLDRVAFEGSKSLVSGAHSFIRVTDTGEGIPKEVLPHVFEPFFTTKEVGQGSGLGLSMVYGFVKQSGGHLSISSVQGKGTSVELYFPSSVTNADNSKSDEGGSGDVVKGRGTILLVEDDESARETTGEILDKLGYQVYQASDGVAALEMVKNFQNEGVAVDLLFSDVVMPNGVDGYELSREIEKRYPEVKILLASGYPDGKKSSLVQGEPSPPVLKKPFGISALSIAIREALDA